MYRNGNPSSKDYSAKPSKYPQKRFNPKPCKMCQKVFEPLAPSHLHCSDACKDRAHSDGYLKRTYGIGIAEYERLLKQQNNVCKICGETGFLMNEAKHKVKLVVDHCHSSGKVRGLLCHNCNRGLGLFKDHPERLLEAARYLEGATTIP